MDVPQPTVALWMQGARPAFHLDQGPDLTVTPDTLAEVPAPWRDEPLELVPPQETLVVHPSHATAIAGPSPRPVESVGTPLYFGL